MGKWLTWRLTLSSLYLCIQQVVKAMYTTICAKTQINGDRCGGIVSDICVKARCPLPPTLFGLCIDELETYLDEIDRGSLCLFSIVVAIILYSDDVVMLLESRVGFQRILKGIWVFHFFSSWY